MPASNQLATWSDMTAAGVTYKNGGPPGGTSMIVASDFNYYITNDAGYPWGYASNQCMTFGDMQAHKASGIIQHTGTMTSSSGIIYETSTYNSGTGVTTYYSNSPDTATTTNTPSAKAPSSSTPMTVSLSISGLPESWYSGPDSGTPVVTNGQVVAELHNPSGSIVASFSTTGTTLSGSYSTPGQADGAYSWHVYATWDTITNHTTGGTPFTVSWTGSYTYYA
jgi:hypothetical protein